MELKWCRGGIAPHVWCEEMTAKSNIVDERLHLIEGDGTKLPNQEQYIKIEWNVIVAAVVGRRFGGCVIIIKHSIAPEINIYAYVLRIYEIWILCKSLVMQSQKYAIRQPREPTLAARLFSIPVVWNRAIECMCVTAIQGRTHTPDPASTDAKKRKIGRKQRTSYEMSFRTNHILYVWEIGASARVRRERTTRARDFYCKFRYIWLCRGCRTQNSQHQHHDYTVTSLYFACGVHSTRFTDIRYSTSFPSASGMNVNCSLAYRSEGECTTLCERMYDRKMNDTIS